MVKKLLSIFIASVVLVQFIESAMVMSGPMMGPPCQEFCPKFCEGKCTGTKAKAECNGEKCHCQCLATTVACKEDECNSFCEKMEARGGRVFKATCLKGTVCKCNFGDPSKENINIMEYPKTGDYRADVQIIPQ